jgi:hypothetical protein
MISDDIITGKVRAIMREGLPRVLRSLLATATDSNAKECDRLRATEIILIGVERGAWEMPKRILRR